MMELEEMRKGLKDRVLTRVAAATGINRNLLGNIRDGKPTNLRTDTIQKLTDYLGKGDAD